MYLRSEINKNIILSGIVSLAIGCGLEFATGKAQFTFLRSVLFFSFWITSMTIYRLFFVELKREIIYMIEKYTFVKMLSSDN